MRGVRPFLLGLLLCVPTLVNAQDAAPSGQPLVLWEVRWERVPGGSDVQLILRALAPELKDRGFDAAQVDMAWICATHGVSIAALPYAKATQVVVNLGDKPVPRGLADPEATQFFEVYRLTDGACISEDF